MKIKYVQLLLVLMVLTYILISSSESAAKETKSIEQMLIETANELNKQLPMILDKETTLDTVIAYKKTFRYKCTLTNTTKDQFNYPVIKRLKEPELINNVCSNKNMSILLNKGVNYIYIYYDKSGTELIRFDIDRSKCRK